MAVTTVQPFAPPCDLVTYKEAKKLFARTGHEVSISTMRRWNVVTFRLHGVVYASYSDLLVKHAAWVAAARSTVP